MNLVKVEDVLNIANAKIIDIRDNERFNEGNIPGSINIPMEKLTTDPSLYLNKNNTYYIYCEFGYKTKRVSKVLTELGYQVISISDGYYAYEMIKK